MSDQGRPLEQGADRGDVRSFQSNLGEAVLGDLNLWRRPASSACADAASGRPSSRSTAPRPPPTSSKRRRGGRRRPPSFPLYPRCCLRLAGKPRLLRNAALRRPKASRATLCACPRSGRKPNAGQKVRTLLARRATAQRDEIRSSPSMQAPAIPVGSVRELSRSRNKAPERRRQSRTGHGRKRRRVAPGPPAYPPPAHRRVMFRPGRRAGGSQKCSKGPHRAADPKRASLSSSNAFGKRRLCSAHTFSPERGTREGRALEPRSPDRGLSAIGSLIL